MRIDFISAEPGIYRKAQTIPGHRYQIEAWGKRVRKPRTQRSQSRVELSLGVDPTGGEDWQGASIECYAWDEIGEDVRVHTQVTVQTSGEFLTIFLKDYLPFAAQSGATLFDAVRVVDLAVDDNALLCFFVTRDTMSLQVETDRLGSFPGGRTTTS